MNRKTGILAAMAASLLIANAASAMYILDNAYEMKCAQGVSKGLAKFTGAKAKCYTKCNQAIHKGLISSGSCNPPSPSDAATQTCIFDPIKGAEAKAITALNKGCFIDCPECYNGGDCTGYSPGRVASVESQLDAFVGLIWCESGPTDAEAKCEDTVAKTLAKFVAAKSKCYDKCLKAQFAGKLPPGYSCTPPATEPSTVGCIILAENKAADAIDKACAQVDNPECYVPNFDTGIEWVNVAESAVDANIVQTYCGSPSGAFLD